jgi:hypothetical protein
MGMVTMAPSNDHLYCPEQTKRQQRKGGWIDEQGLHTVRTKLLQCSAVQRRNGEHQASDDDVEGERGCGRKVPSVTRVKGGCECLEGSAKEWGCAYHQLTGEEEQLAASVGKVRISPLKQRSRRSNSGANGQSGL